MLRVAGQVSLVPYRNAYVCVFVYTKPLSVNFYRQNNVTELFSLLKFLRIKPLSNWDTFNEQIAKPVNSARGAGRAMKRLQVVLKQIMLRRRKDQLLNGQALIKLPERHVDIISCKFDAAEKEFYHSLETKMEDVIAKIMTSKGGNRYIGVLTLLLRLRQGMFIPVCNLRDDDHYHI